MSQFLSTFDGRLLDEQEAGRELWMLLAPFRYESDLYPGYLIEALPGWVTDGESIPHLFSGLTGAPCRKAGTVHDWLYQLHPFGDAEDQRERTDHIYLEAMLLCGLDRVRAEQRFAAVRHFGRSAWVTGPTRRRILPLS